MKESEGADLLMGTSPIGFEGGDCGLASGKTRGRVSSEPNFF